MSLQEIIAKIQTRIEGAENIHAMWLEGSYATGDAHVESDIDVWVDIDDGSFPETFKIFKEALDEHNLLRSYEDFHVYSKNPLLAKAKFYLLGKNDNQRIELDMQPHSRNFIFSKQEHQIRVLFDKDNTVRWQG
jgi:predicted nucleotidyltransferase